MLDVYGTKDLVLFDINASYLAFIVAFHSEFDKALGTMASSIWIVDSWLVVFVKEKIEGLNELR